MTQIMFEYNDMQLLYKIPKFLQIPFEIRLLEKKIAIAKLPRLQLVSSIGFKMVKYKNNIVAIKVL